MSPENNFENNLHKNPELIEASHGDEILLERLIALRKTRTMYEQDPENPSMQVLVELAEQNVTDRQQQIGLLPPTGTPDTTA